MEDIQNKFKIINELSNNLSVLHRNNNNFNDKSKKSFEIKLKLFSENLDLILENLTDLTNDITQDYSELSKNVQNYCKDSTDINSICKEFYPLILLKILSRNITDQGYL
tara:strand:+ start:734 stop:1060 length:327 start_codon:yes stop_codon:yes gene_type:complete